MEARLQEDYIAEEEVHTWALSRPICIHISLSSTLYLLDVYHDVLLSDGVDTLDLRCKIDLERYLM